MFETFESGWKLLRNPFQALPESGEVITSRISGRKADIQEIVSGGQNAIILAGAPHIGKTSLLRYLLRPAGPGWSWRDELEDLRPYLKLDEVSFAQIDLLQLEGVTDADDLLMPFIAQCIAALQSMWPQVTGTYSGLKGLRELLRYMSHEYPDARYFTVLDNLERLQGPDMPPLKEATQAKTPQERGLALLDDTGAFRVLVDLLDEFPQFGIILAIESLPSPRISKQFIHISADLARFRTMMLQVFTQEDTLRFLAQGAESFGEEWARQFREAGGNVLFSPDMQVWLYESAGSHPYLLRQFCFDTFHFKREYALKQGFWSDLQKDDREQLIERVSERVSTFLDRIWKRIGASMDASSPETREKFYDFISRSKGKSANDVVDSVTWNQLGSELRYILYSEGIVRYDPLQPVHFPGSLLLNYLAQRVEEQDRTIRPAISYRSHATTNSDNELIITLPGKQPQHLELSLLEYALMKALLHQPGKCSEEALMRAAWGKFTSKQVLTQRLFHLRKKLRETCGEEMIENIYGGSYTLKHPEWFSWQ